MTFSPRALLAPALLGLGLLPATVLSQKDGVAPALAPPMPAPAPGYSYPQHQTLTYTVDWRVFTAGRVVFQLDQQNGIAKVQASADTIGATNMIYQVIDRFQSSFNVQTNCSAGFSKQTQEGRRRVSSDLVFTPGTGSAAASCESSPNPSLRPDAACTTSCTPAATSSKGTPQRLAAAASSIIRAAAPTCRIGTR